MKRKLFTLLLLTVIIFGCEKQNQKLGEFLLGDFLETNPFNGNETLVYRHSITDSLHKFYGDGRYSETYHTTPTNNPTTDYWVNEWNWCSFTSLDGSCVIRIEMDTHLDRFVDIGQWYGEKIDNEYRGMSVEARMPLSMEQFQCCDKFYLDSLQVFDQCYKEVFADSNTRDRTMRIYEKDWLDNYPTTFYYTVTDGIIKIDFVDGSFLGLVEVQSP